MRWTNRHKHTTLNKNNHKDKSKHYNDNWNNKNNNSNQQEDLTEKLKKYADLKKQGLLTEEEFQKLKADLLSKL